MRHYIFIFLLLLCFPLRGQTLKDSSTVNDLNKQVMELVYTNTSKAKALCFKSMTLAKNIGFKKGEASANSRLGIVYDVEGNYDSAIHYYRIAYGINKKIGNKKGQGAALSNIGLVYLNMNDYGNAISNLRAAIKPLEEAREHEYLGNCYNNIGLMYTELDNYQRAMDNFRLAKKEYFKSGNTNQMAYVISNIAMVLSEKNEFDSAILYEHKAIPYFEKDSDYYNLAKCYNNIGVDYSRMNNHQKAIDNYLISVKYALLYNSKGGLADTYANLATEFSLIGDFKQSEKYASEAFALLPHIKSPKIKADLFFLCGRIKIRQGDYKSATKYLMDAKWLKDSIFKKEAAELLTKSEIRFGLERKENENKQLQTQNRIQQLELRNTENEIESRKTFNIVVIVLSSLIILLLVLYLRRRLMLQRLIDENKSKAEQQEQRIRISHELHDNVGAQLSYIVSNLDVMSQQHPEDKRLNSLSDMSKQAIVTLRETVWALNNESISVTDFADKFKQYTSKILNFNQDVTCTFEEQFQDQLILQPIQALNLFRICQEAFSNAIHHAHASIIRVQFSNSGNDIFTVSIQDNGIGFDQEEAALKGHYGLNSMRSRAKEMGAHFVINSVKNEGTQVIFTLDKH
ncbi:MAG: tetratricopeptide repeat protein [Chitinophagaceae bacterium]